VPRDAVVSIGGVSGHVAIENSPADSHLVVEITESLLPVLMPLLAGLRRVFDLDAEPAVIDAHLAAGGLRRLVARWPGVRVPGSFTALTGADPDGFSVTDPLLMARAEQWRPWRAYAAQLLTLERESVASQVPEVNSLRNSRSAHAAPRARACSQDRPVTSLTSR
jgi:3-methyladenine DNA glycosylase/8-oxoguanine DNA glycosylase